MSTELQPFAELNFGSFRMSPQVDQLFTALAIAQGKFGGVIKDKTANVKTDKASYSYSYADLGSVLDACREALTENGLCVLQPASTNGPKVIVATIIAHKSGQWLSSDLEMNATQNTPQGVGSAVTYARRYGLSAMVGIASEVDDDGKAASEPPRPPARQPATKAPAKPAVPLPMPSELNSPISEMLSRMKDKYSALSEFARMKKEFIELAGDEGELNYYDALRACGVEKSDQFETLGQSKRAAQFMQELLLKRSQKQPDELRELAESLPRKVTHG